MQNNLAESSVGFTVKYAQPKLNGTTSQYLRGDGTLQTLNPSAAGLGILTNNTTKITVAGAVEASAGWGGTTSSAGKMGGIPMLITCERNGIGTLNSSLAFGNGATLQDGLTFPFSGKLIAATMTCSSLTGTVTVRAYKNSIAQNAFSLTASSSGATVSAIQNWQSAPLSFSSGDLFVFKQIAVPTSADCFVVVFFIVFD